MVKCGQPGQQNKTLLHKQAKRMNCKRWTVWCRVALWTQLHSVWQLHFNSHMCSSASACEYSWSWPIVFATGLYSKSNAQRERASQFRNGCASSARLPYEEKSAFQILSSLIVSIIKIIKVLSNICGLNPPKRGFKELAKLWFKASVPTELLISCVYGCHSGSDWPRGLQGTCSLFYWILSPFNLPHASNITYKAKYFKYFLNNYRNMGGGFAIM